MSKNISEIPVTEIVERSKQISRVGSNTDSKVRGVIQDIYLRDMMAKHDWNFLMVESSFTTIEKYDTGTVTINTGDTAVQGTDTVWTADMVGRKIKFTGNDAVYDIITFGATTSISILPVFRGASNISSGSYKIYQPIYPLALDFDRFPKSGGIWKWSGGEKVLLEEESYDRYASNYTSSLSIPEKVRLVGTNTAGVQQVELRPPPADARNYSYEYLRKVSPLTETTAGTLLSLSANATAVSGNTNTRFLDAYRTGSDNLFFRVDNLGISADSEWFRILAIANNSSLTLASIFANTAITSSANYTIARAPEMPARMHIGVLYGTVRNLELDQNSETFAFYHGQYAMVMSDSKRIYVSRPYSQEIEGVHTDYEYRR